MNTTRWVAYGLQRSMNNWNKDKLNLNLNELIGGSSPIYTFIPNYKLWLFLKNFICVMMVHFFLLSFAIRILSNRIYSYKVLKYFVLLHMLSKIELHLWFWLQVIFQYHVFLISFSPRLDLIFSVHFYYYTNYYTTEEWHLIMAWIDKNK